MAKAVVVALGLGLAACESGSGEIGATADGGGSAIDGGTVDGAAVDAGPRKRVFVTAANWTGNLRLAGGTETGVEGGDVLCNDAAAGAQLGGSWQAWLGTTGLTAKERIHWSGPWYLVDGTTLVFASREQLASNPTSAILLEESGEQVEPGTWVWTGSHVADLDCGGWTSDETAVDGMTGQPSATSNDWQEYVDFQCSQQMRLYCFEE